MSTALALTAAAASVGGWFLLYLGVRSVTRPAAVRSGPATPKLGDETPAVVNLLANGWRLTIDAAEATLLDLAARQVIEVRQAGDDPRHTTIHVRQESPAGLLPYERRVLERVKAVAHDGVLPVTALAFRDRFRARAWHRGLRGAVTRDARRRGLSRRRISDPLIAVLGVGALVAAGGPALVAPAVLGLAGTGALSYLAYMLCLLVLFGIIERTHGERDTPAGAGGGGGCSRSMRGSATAPPPGVSRAVGRKDCAPATQCGSPHVRGAVG